MVDLLATEGSNNFSTFLSQLSTNTAEKVGETIVALVMATIVKVGTSERVVSRPKKHPVLKEKCSAPPPPIAIPEEPWINEGGTYFSRYNHVLDLTNLLSWLSISMITNPKTCFVTLRTARSSATLPVEFMFMSRKGMNKDLFYMYDCLFHNLHVSVSFDDFTMGVLWILNVALMQLHLNGWAPMQALQALCLYSSLSATLDFSCTTFVVVHRTRFGGYH